MGALETPTQSGTQPEVTAGPVPGDPGRRAPSKLVGERVTQRKAPPHVAVARKPDCRIVVGHEMLREKLPVHLDFFGLSAGSGNNAPRRGR